MTHSNLYVAWMAPDLDAKERNEIALFTQSVAARHAAQFRASFSFEFTGCTPEAWDAIRAELLQYEQRQGRKIFQPIYTAAERQAMFEAPPQTGVEPALA